MKYFLYTAGCLALLAGGAAMLRATSVGGPVLIVGALFLCTGAILDKADDLAALIRWMAENWNKP